MDREKQKITCEIKIPPSQSEESLDTFSKRLAYALKTLNISQAELARKIGVKRQAIQYLSVGDIRKTKFSYEIGKALGVDTDWLNAGLGEMLPDRSPREKALQQQQVVPVLEWHLIQPWLENKIGQENIYSWTCIEKRGSDDAFALHLNNNAMAPNFDARTVVIVEPSLIIDPPCLVIVYSHEMNDVVFRELIRKKNGKCVLSVFNEAGYKTLPFGEKDRILGYVTAAKWFLNSF